jgi:glycosyltransferase involved in cell wall biosynthesis
LGGALWIGFFIRISNDFRSRCRVVKARRVAVFITDLSGGGAERVAVNLANEFIRRGYQVDMVLMYAEGEFQSHLEAAVRVIDLGARRMRWSLLPLIRYFKRVRPDAFLANMWPLTVEAVVARAIARVNTRLVVVEHTTWSHSEILTSRFRRWLVRSSMAWFFRWADGIVAVSRGAADDLNSFSGIDREMIEVIYNPICGGRATSDSAVLASGPGIADAAGWTNGPHKRVLAVGRLKKIKNYAVLIEAFALLRAKIDARLLILGEGECRNELEVLIRDRGLEGAIFLPGFSAATRYFYDRADLHVLSSDAEGFGNVIVEALDAGIPVVSTDCPSGPNEILCGGDYGHLVPVGNAEALAAAMAEALTTPFDASSLRARAQDFSIEKAVDQYEALLFPRGSARVS